MESLAAFVESAVAFVYLIYLPYPNPPSYDLLPSNKKLFLFLKVMYYAKFILPLFSNKDL